MHSRLQSRQLDVARLLGDVARGAAVQVTVSSASMRPTIAAGEVITVRAAARYRAGDIALFSERGRLIAHRLVAGGFGVFVHSGDAGGTRGIVFSRDIIGRVAEVAGRRPGPPPPLRRRLRWACLALLGR